ncbi:MAG: hypothetical protein KJO69_09870 [Gammaproteobacteria bacterium]|nr:hypothetical protein [Gammaproteobacteria bacterium]
MFKYNKQKDALYCVLSGGLDKNEFRQEIKGVVESTEHPPNIRSIWDVTELDFSQITADFQRELILIRKSFPERHPARIAVVVPDQLGFGMARMYEMLSMDVGDNLKVFYDFAEAEEWLLEAHE